jgi:hypothetical protein
MAARSLIIATACDVVLDRRVRGDDATIAEVRRRVGGTPADLAAAEFWATWATMTREQLDDAYRAGISQVDGTTALRAVRDANRPIGVVR